MSVRFDRRATVHGMPVALYRDILIAWESTLSVTALTRNRKLGLGERGPIRAACIVDDFEARGLIGKGCMPTRAGKALMNASPMTPIAAAAGEAVLDGLVHRAAAMNADASNPLMVRKIWSFGSLAKGAAMVNDVDVHVEEATKPSLTADARDGALLAYAREHGLCIGSGIDMGRVEDAVRRHALHGGRRHPRLQVLETVDRLAEMGEPCRLVFDSSRGGPVDDPLLPRHPRSKGRNPAFGPPPPMPDLSLPVAVGPSSVVPALYLARETASPAMAEAVDRVDFIAPENPAEDVVARWASAQGPLDMRGRCCLVAYGPGGVGPVTVMLDRGVEGGTRPSTVIEAIMFPSHASPYPRTDEALAHVIATMMACDAEKVRFLHGWDHDVAVEVGCDAEHPWADALRDKVHERLASFTHVALDDAGYRP